MKYFIVISLCWYVFIVKKNWNKEYNIYLVTNTWSKSFEKLFFIISQVQYHPSSQLIPYNLLATQITRWLANQISDFSDGRVWTSLSELVKIEQKLDQHPVKFISRNLYFWWTSGHAYWAQVKFISKSAMHMTRLFFWW